MYGTVNMHLGVVSICWTGQLTQQDVQVVREFLSASTTSTTSWDSFTLAILYSRSMVAFHSNISIV